MTELNDGRISFDEAVHFVQQMPGKAAFAAMPVFGELSDDAEQRAEGARLFIVESDGAGSYRVRFIAGPFFANVHGADEIMAADEVPESVKQLRYLTTQLDEAWLENQIQILIQKLMQASGQMAAEMPDYASAPAVAADADATFPISFIGRDAKRQH